MKISVLLFSLILLTACNRGDLSLKMEAFPLEKSLKGEAVLMQDIINPGFIMLKKKSLFVSSVNSDSMLYQYSIPDFTSLSKGGLKGQGENEFQLFPMFCRTMSDYVYIWGYNPLVIKSFILGDDQSLSFSHEYVLPFYESFNQMHIIKDSILVYSAIPGEFAVKKIDLKKKKELGKISIKKDEHMESFFYKNKGIIAVNDSFIVYGYTYKKQIDIYNVSDLKLKKRIIGGDLEPIIRIGDFDNNKNYYINLVAGEEFFYALCQGEERDCWLEKFDYEGHSVARYKFDIVPYMFDIDETNNCIYVFNYQYEDYFYKYSIN
ncbi:MAG: hypothetical protein KH897_14675 [Bacteroides sp.]|uniref:hypothetical protein n=1 Tax=Bacteroides sp. TaxID=29523 RepID=UPI0025C728D8|nr:hypothetical protein [Bacteroides sp.]MBS6239569.1 hypothetical protein [Bacteroides sp.]